MPRQAGVKDGEIEITPEMIEAGVRVLQGQFPDGLLQGFAGSLATDVFVGMLSVSPSECLCSD